ncbi:hypothetical protein GIB67_038430, partial [Kingdonia uniflora]
SATVTSNYYCYSTSNCYNYSNFELRNIIKLRDSNSQRNSIQFERTRFNYRTRSDAM